MDILRVLIYEIFLNEKKKLTFSKEIKFFMKIILKLSIN